MAAGDKGYWCHLHAKRLEDVSAYLAHIGSYPDCRISPVEDFEGESAFSVKLLKSTERD